MRPEHIPTYWEDSASVGNWNIHNLLFDDVNPNLFAGGGSFQIISQFKVNPPTHDINIDRVTALTCDMKIMSMQTDDQIRSRRWVRALTRIRSLSLERLTSCRTVELLIAL